MAIRCKYEPMDIYLKEAKLLGMTYGQYQGMCFERYPRSNNPLMAYVTDTSVTHSPEAVQFLRARDGKADREITTADGKGREAYCHWCGGLYIQRNLKKHFCCQEHADLMQKHRARVYTSRRKIKLSIECGVPEENFGMELDMLAHKLAPEYPLEEQPPVRVREWMGGGSDE